MTIHLNLPLSKNPRPAAEPDSLDELPVISVYTDDDAVADGVKTEHAYQPAAGRRIDLGRMFVTGGAETLLDRTNHDRGALLGRHQSGDWGSLSAADRAANDRALRYGGRLLSTYTIGDEKVWIITEADRRATTLLLPSEY